MKNNVLFVTIIFLLSSEFLMSQTKGTFTDPRDSKTYKTVTIGTQTWMSENLAYKASNGCYAYNSDISNVAKFGCLYDWETVKKVCPTGWHLPTSAEWDTLNNSLGGKDEAMKKLKSNTDWYANGNGNNSSGFNALPSGYQYSDNAFYSINTGAYFWLSTEVDNNDAWYYILSFNDSQESPNYDSKKCSMSCRCVKD